MAAIVLIPILVPAATATEVSAPMIRRNRKTPSKKPIHSIGWLQLLNWAAQFHQEE